MTKGVAPHFNIFVPARMSCEKGNCMFKPFNLSRQRSGDDSAGPQLSGGAALTNWLLGVGGVSLRFFGVSTGLRLMAS